MTDPAQRKRPRVTLNLTGDEALALAMALDAAITNALVDDDGDVLQGVFKKLQKARLGDG